MSLRRLAISSLLFITPTLLAQRHGDRSSPPTAHNPQAQAQTAPPSGPIAPVSSGLGSIQFVPVNYGVPAPQALTRQLRFEDDRTRAAALSAVGAPGQYLQRGHIPMPRAIDLQLAPLGTTDELDAILTVELDQHIVSAVLIPVEGNWRRVATLSFATPFHDAQTTPSSWLRLDRSLQQPDRYRAIFRGSYGSLKSNFGENEVHLRVLNNRAIITMSFEATKRECFVATPTGPRTPHTAAKSGCDVTRRWFQPDPVEPVHHYLMVSGTGHETPREAASLMSDSLPMLVSRLRSFTCQQYVYSESAQKYEPASPNGACKEK